MIVVAADKETKATLDHRRKIEQINVLNYQYAQKQMKQVYKKYNDALTQILAFIGLLYMSYSIDGVVKINNYQKTYILSDLYNKLQPIQEQLGKFEVNEIADVLNKAYENTYIKNAFLMGIKLNTPSAENINKAVKTKIDGELFLDRIWNNKEDLIKRIKESVNAILNGSMTIDQAGKQIEKIFNISAYQSHRLLVTELSRVQAQASIDMAKATGIKKHMWSATFEHTCEHCVELDGEVFKIDDKEAPIIPAHPNCQCLWVNILESDRNKHRIGYQGTYNDEKNHIKTDLVGVRRCSDYAKNELGIKNVDLKEIKNTDVLEPFLRELYLLKNEYGTMFNKVESPSWLTNENTIAQVNGSVLQLNPRYFNNVNNLNEQLKLWEKTKFIPKDCDNIKYIATHEYIHLLTESEVNNPKSKVHSIFNRAKAKDFVSLYSKKDCFEFVAELLTVNRLNHITNKSILSLLDIFGGVK